VKEPNHFLGPYEMIWLFFFLRAWGKRIDSFRERFLIPSSIMRMPDKWIRPLNHLAGFCFADILKSKAAILSEYGGKGVSYK
jgi:hypothetical protein